MRAAMSSSSSMSEQKQQQQQFREAQYGVFRGMIGGAVTVITSYTVAVLYHHIMSKRKIPRISNHHHEKKDADDDADGKNSDNQDEEEEKEDEVSSLELALQSLVGPACCLLVQIFMLARHRLVTPHDIGGGGLGSDSAKAVLLQRGLQNTLEQTCLAVPTYLASSALLPQTWKYMTPAASMLFTLGRFCFVCGYHRGGGGGGAGGGGVTPGRAYGFAMTFMSTTSLLGMNVYFMIRKNTTSCSSSKKNSKNKKKE